MLSLLPPEGSSLGKWRCNVSIGSEQQCGVAAFLTLLCVLLLRKLSQRHSLSVSAGQCLSYSCLGLPAIHIWLFVSLSIVTRMKRIFQYCVSELPNRRSQSLSQQVRLSFSKWLILIQIPGRSYLWMNSIAISGELFNLSVQRKCR